MRFILVKLFFCAKKFYYINAVLPKLNFIKFPNFLGRKLSICKLIPQFLLELIYMFFFVAVS